MRVILVIEVTINTLLPVLFEMWRTLSSMKDNLSRTHSALIGSGTAPDPDGGKCEYFVSTSRLFLYHLKSSLPGERRRKKKKL